MSDKQEIRSLTREEQLIWEISFLENSMSAKEMFEKLGYEYSKVGEKIYYEEPNPYELGGHSPYIVFYTINKHWDTNIVNVEKDKSLIQAINKQIEELHW